MKGLQGIVLAVVLAIVAALCNWYYIYKQASGYHTESFVIISPGTTLNPGDVIKAEHLARVDVPLDHVGNLREIAILWKDKDAIQSVPAVRAYQGGELFLRADRVTRARKDLSEKISPNEVAFPVPVDSRTFVAENYNPGDSVSFFVSALLDSGDGPGGASPNVAGNIDRLVGPFRILALGARKSTLDVERANTGSGHSARENVITVGLVRKDNQFDTNAKSLLQLLKISTGNGVQVVKHYKAEEK